MDFSIMKYDFDSYFLNNLFIVLPEVILGFVIVVLLCFFMYVRISYGVFGNHNNFLNYFSYSIGLFSICVYVYICLLQLFFEIFNYSHYIFESLLYINTQILLAKLVLGIFIFVISQFYFQNMRSEFKSFNFGFEVIILFLNLLLGMSLCLGSNSLIVFYVSLELQSFCFFILLSINLMKVDSIKSCIIYFLTVVFSSILFLSGLSYIYWRFGSLNTEELSLFIHTTKHVGDFSFIDLFFSLVLILGLLVKVGLFPVHFWVPKVYSDGSLLPVSLIAIVSKIFGVFILFKFFIMFSASVTLFIFIEFFSVFGILVGVFGALTQSNFRALLGYSAIAHVGYIFAVFSINLTDAYIFSLFYLIVYMLNLLPIFLFLLFVRWSKKTSYEFKLLEDFENVKLNNWAQVTIFLAFSTFFFSFIGIPPFSGFFAKFFIIKYLISTSHFFTAVIVGVSSVISAIYYLKIIRHLFFGSRKLSLEEGWELPRFISFFIVFCGLLNISFIFLAPQLLVLLFSFLLS